MKRTSCFGFDLDVFGRNGLVGLDSFRVCSDKASLSVWTRSGGVRMNRAFRFRFGSRREFWFHFGSGVRMRRAFWIGLGWVVIQFPQRSFAR